MDHNMITSMIRLRLMLAVIATSATAYGARDSSLDGWILVPKREYSDVLRWAGKTLKSLIKWTDDPWREDKSEFKEIITEMEKQDKDKDKEKSKDRDKDKSKDEYINKHESKSKDEDDENKEDATGQKDKYENQYEGSVSDGWNQIKKEYDDALTALLMWANDSSPGQVNVTPKNSNNEWVAVPEDGYREVLKLTNEAWTAVNRNIIEHGKQDKILEAYKKISDGATHFTAATTTQDPRFPFQNCVTQFTIEKTTAQPGKPKRGGPWCVDAAGSIVAFFKKHLSHHFESGLNEDKIPKWTQLPKSELRALEKLAKEALDSGGYHKLSHGISSVLQGERVDFEKSTWYIVVSTVGVDRECVTMFKTDGNDKQPYLPLLLIGFANPGGIPTTKCQRNYKSTVQKWLTTPITEDEERDPKASLDRLTG